MRTPITRIIFSAYRAGVSKQISPLRCHRPSLGVNFLPIVRFNSTKKKVDQAAHKKPPPTSSEAQEKIDHDPKEHAKLTLWQKVKKEAQHYWAGTKLLGFELKVATKLLSKMMRGYELSRRERAQLKRTVIDVVRLVPFSAFVLIPFAELLLPVALKLFPNMLPLTYELKIDKEKKRTKFRETREKTSEFLRNTILESDNLMKLPQKISEGEKVEFLDFFRKINHIDRRPTNEQIIKVAQSFKDDDVLDNLSRPQLVAMARYIGLTPFGTDNFIRYQIRTKLIEVVRDDRAIRYEGVDSLSVTELRLALGSRGMKNVDLSPGRLRDDLTTWLDFRLKKKVPLTLLVLSSIYTYGQSGVNNYYDALLSVLSSIPDEVYDITKSELSDDYRAKLNVLKEQEERIQEEKEQEKDMGQSDQTIQDDKNLEDESEGKVEKVEGREEEKVEVKAEEAKQEAKQEVKK